MSEPRERHLWQKELHVAIDAATEAGQQGGQAVRSPSSMLDTRAHTAQAT
jgi:hypothetical protein